MTVRFRELYDDELPEFLAAADSFYVADLVENAGLTEEQAREKSARDHESLFSGGKRRPGHHVCAIEDAKSGERIGRIWFHERDDGVVFVYQIEIQPEQRGRGRGREAMQLLEDEARKREASAIELNVFGGNEVARGLYRSLGYAEQAVYLRKPL